MILKKRTELVKKDIDEIEAKNADFYPAITAAGGAPNFALRLFEIGPKGHTPFHSHEWEHEAYIIDGSGFIVEDSKKARIKKSDFIYVEPGENTSFQPELKG